MKPPCMLVVSYILPAVRSLAADQLKRQYNLKPSQVAAKMSVSPAAITQYMKGARGQEMTGLIRKSKRIEGLVSEMVEKMMRPEGEENTLNRLCEICRIIRSERSIYEAIVDKVEKETKK